MLSKECCLSGIIIILKQLPHAFGYDNDFEGDQTFLQNDGGNTLLLFRHFNYLQLGL
jgi:hypothetical protein